MSTLRGRDAELALALEVLAEADQGHGGLVCFVGEPGIGKSRLLQELEKSAQAQATHFAIGRTWEGGGAPAAWPLRQALGQLAARCAPFRAHPLVAAIVEPRVGEAPSPLPDAESERFGWMHGLSRALELAAAERPVVLAFEDLHAADQLTLRWIHFLARSRHGRRLALVLTYRDVDARHHELAALFTELEREARVVPLRRLAADEVHAWVHDAGLDASGLAEGVAKLSLGNPLFVEELVRAARAEPGRPLATLPHRVEPLVRDRLERVSPSTRAVLERAAVLGPEPELETLRALATTPLEAALDEARRHELVATSGTALRFAYPLAREVLLELCAPAERGVLHLAAADALQRAPLPAHERITHHLLGAAAAGAAIDLHRLVRTVQLAADAHLHAHAHEDALALLESVRRVVSHLPWAHAELLLGLARVLTRSGSVDQARTRCLEAAALARTLGDGALLARAALASGDEFDPGSVDPSLVALLEEALGALPEHEVALRAGVLARHAAALQPASEPAQLVEQAKAAIALARGTNDASTVLAVLHSAMAALMDFADPRERQPLNTEQLALAVQANDRARALRAHLRLMFDAVELGDWPELEGHARAFEQLARELRQDRLLAGAALTESMLAVARGDFGRSEAVVATVPPSRWLPFHALGVARTRELPGRVAELTRGLRLAWGNDPVLSLYVAPLEASAAARAGRADDAHYWLSKVADCAFVREDVAASSWWLEAAAFAGDDGLRRRLLELKRSRSGQFTSWGFVGQHTEGPVDRLLALLAAALGDWPQAEGFFGSAERQLRALRLEPLLARLLHERAREKAKAGVPFEDDARESRAIAERLGLEGLLTAPVAPATRALQLAREGEVWAVAWRGQTHRLKDSRGLQLLARLVETPGVDVHVLELSSEGDAIESDAGPMLDAAARRDYQDRLESLDDAIDEARSHADRGRLEKAEAEREFLLAELSRAVGLGGRERKVGSNTERARVAVTRRLRDAVDRIGKLAPELGTYLDRAVKTGTHCRFEP